MPLQREKTWVQEMSRSSASHGPVLGAYFGVAGLLALGARRFGGPSLPRPRFGDVVLLALATLKLSRLLTKEKVTQPLREPFVESVEPGEGSEVNCEPAGAGIRRSIGELLTCPFCLSVWIVTIMIGAFAVAPRAVRLVASGLAALVLADSGQYAFTGLRKVA
jgi:hypothetical protein